MKQILFAALAVTLLSAFASPALSANQHGKGADGNSGQGVGGSGPGNQGKGNDMEVGNAGGNGQEE